MPYRTCCSVWLILKLVDIAFTTSDIALPFGVRQHLWILFLLDRCDACSGSGACGTALMLMQVLGGGAPWPRLRLPAGGLVRAEAVAATNRGFTRADPDAPGGADRPTHYPPCKRLCNGAHP